MPILKENRKLYPKNWKEISQRIRFERAQNKCEFCGVENYSNGYWIDDRFVTIQEIFECLDNTEDIDSVPEDKKPIKIVLTVAHLDHDPTNNEESNLKALCQRCHNRYDGKHRSYTKKNGKLKNQLKLNL